MKNNQKTTQQQDFTKLIKKYEKYISLKCNKYPTMADDIKQEIHLNLWQLYKSNKYNPEKSKESTYYIEAINRAVSHYLSTRENQIRKNTNVYKIKQDILRLKREKKAESEIYDFIKDKYKINDNEYNNIKIMTNGILSLNTFKEENDLDKNKALGYIQPEYEDLEIQAFIEELGDMIRENFNESHSQAWEEYLDGISKGFSAKKVYYEMLKEQKASYSPQWFFSMVSKMKKFVVENYGGKL